MPRCLECSNWTLKPRTDVDESLSDSDRAYAANGWGRCLLDGLSRRWFPGELVRECDRFAQLPADQVKARRDWLAKQGSQA